MVFACGDVRIDRRREAATACGTIDSGVDIPPEVLTPHPFRPHLHRIGEILSSEREKSERALPAVGRPAVIAQRLGSRHTTENCSTFTAGRSAAMRS
jgi:hypothetical protein